MKVTVLIENTTSLPVLIPEHGLSLFVETQNNKILIDTGATGEFINNAEKLGIDLKNVDIVILSHGHYDHCGGVIPFNKINDVSKIYINKNSFGDFYDTDGKYIGIDKSILSLTNVVLTDKYFKINDDISLFSEIKGRRYFPQGNSRLLKIENGKSLKDDFIHEQFAVITENGKNYLFSGCAHNGIVNILDRFIDEFGKTPDAVFSGFHLMKKTEYTVEEIDFIKQTSLELCKYDTVFYTGHCTGEALPILKDIMGEKLKVLKTGESFVL